MISLISFVIFRIILYVYIYIYIYIIWYYIYIYIYIYMCVCVYIYIYRINIKMKYTNEIWYKVCIFENKLYNIFIHKRIYF